MHTDALIREHALKRLARSITVRQPKRKHSTPPSCLANGLEDWYVSSWEWLTRVIAVIWR